MLAVGQVEIVKNEKVIMGVVWYGGKCYLKLTKIKNSFISKSGCISFTIFIIIITMEVAQPVPEWKLCPDFKSEVRIHLSFELKI